MHRHFALLASAIGLSLCASSAPYQNTPGSRTANIPTSIVGKHVVYDSGSVSRINAQKLPLIGAILTERAIYNKDNNLRDLSRVTYNPRNGSLIYRDFVQDSEWRDLSAKNPVYRRCRRPVVKPAVRFQVKANKNANTGLYFTDLWTVEQITPECKLMRIRHHSRDNSCESFCDRWAKSTNPNMTKVRLVSSQQYALQISRARRK